MVERDAKIGFIVGREWVCVLFSSIVVSVVSRRDDEPENLRVRRYGNYLNYREEK